MIQLFRLGDDDYVALLPHEVVQAGRDYIEGVLMGTGLLFLDLDRLFAAAIDLRPSPAAQELARRQKLVQQLGSSGRLH